MNAQLQMQPQSKAQPASAFAPVPARSHLVQRQCACGSTPGPSRECAECHKPKLQHKSETLGSGISDRLPDSVMNAFMETRAGHDFGTVRVLSSSAGSSQDGPIHRNAARDDTTFEQMPGSEEQPSDREDQLPSDRLSSESFGPIGTPLGGGGTGTSSTCPTKTVLARTIDATPAGLKAGYWTGYGVVAVMRTEPVPPSWDGTQIAESLKQTSNTCPAEFGIDPCKGGPPFTVGAASHSSVLGDLPAQANCFYDNHFTRWNKGSLLHDPARNPKNIAACQISCEQTYSCGGTAIGTHTVTRNFTKGTQGTRDVTVVNVTKT